MTTKTALEIKDDFIKHGLKVSDWAKKHGVPARTVTDLLSGRARGRWGHSHRVAVLLGLKEGIIDQEDNF